MEGCERAKGDAGEIHVGCPEKATEGRSGGKCDAGERIVLQVEGAIDCDEVKG